jgi:hypothetical protein
MIWDSLSIIFNLTPLLSITMKLKFLLFAKYFMLKVQWTPKNLFVALVRSCLDTRGLSFQTRFFEKKWDSEGNYKDDRGFVTVFLAFMLSFALWSKFFELKYFFYYKNGCLSRFKREFTSSLQTVSLFRYNWEMCWSFMEKWISYIGLATNLNSFLTMQSKNHLFTGNIVS